MNSVMTAPPVFSQRYRALGVGMVAIIMLIAFEYLAVATAMPVVAQRLDGMALYGLAFNASLVASVMATLVGGRWSDARGPLVPLWTGLAGFGGGLLLAGTAQNMEVFVAGRFLQGLGGGLFSVALYVLIDRVYPAEMHPKVFSLLSAAWVVPSLVGPAITGVVVQHVGWRWVFLGVPMIAAPAAVFLWRGLADYRRTRTAPAAAGLDLGDDSGAATGDAPAAAATGTRKFAIKLVWGVVVATGATLMQYGSGSGAVPLLITGLAVLAVALPRLLPKGTLRVARGVPAVVALRGLAAGAFFAAEVFVPLVLTTGRGLSPTEAGLALTGGALFWSTGSWIQGRKPRDRRLILRTGTSLIATAILLAGLMVFPSVPVLVGFLGWCVGGLGMGLTYPTLSVLILKLSPPAEKGANSASLSIGESVYSVVAVAVTGAISTAAHRSVASYVVCFGLLALMAGAAAVSSGRFEHPRAAGTMEV
ncbi:MFS transporter [Microtetraspora malaysiensis]|uniref:MFS transporter n=1 Tax=Microtetraspora malaysiensis TaxID=161358 RepID=UPI001FE03EBA|nr:MFS transporter [Microtetraspora malaysiensis]